MKSAKRGFTALEVVIIVVIIAILLAIAIPNLMRANRDRAERGLNETLKTVRLAVSLFHDDTGLYPTRLSDLESLRLHTKGLGRLGTEAPIDPADWHGPYLHEVPEDPISGEAFKYDTSPPNVGDVRSSARGEAMNGTAYIDW